MGKREGRMKTTLIIQMKRLRHITLTLASAMLLATVPAGATNGRDNGMISSGTNCSCKSNKSRRAIEAILDGWTES